MLKRLITAFGISPSRVMNTESIRQTADVASTSYRSMMDRTKEGRYRNETFQEAVERLGLNENMLNRRRKELMIESRVAYAMMFLTILTMFHFVSNESWGGLVSGFCAVIIFGCIGLTRAFRVHQIDKRDLMGFPSFLRNFEGVFK